MGRCSAPTSGGDPRLIGYARVSTDEQSPALQFDALKRAGCVEIFADQASGADASRPALDRLLFRLAAGDVLVTWKLDRLGRSLSHLLKLTADLEGRGVGFKSLSEAIDTRSASGRLLFHVLGALAEFERALISERTRAGMAAARERGSTPGRPEKLSSDDAERICQALRETSCGVRELAKKFGVSPSTIRRTVGRKRRVHPDV